MVGAEAQDEGAAVRDENEGAGIPAERGRPAQRECSRGGGGGGGRPEAADVTQDAADDEDADDSADGEDLRKRQLPFSNRGALLRFNIEGRHTMV